ncbi:hypothetical protein [Ulvibacterium sp.]|uniref:hypothetical protein n=1 Tax=Ulvibacterium sp. TaxID=2665914 RepID=UPI0026175FC1|nr:hypothetical protein [Ulvibacterium sp.]
MNQDPNTQGPDKDEEFRILTPAEHERNATEWFGAIIRYLWHLGQRKFDTFYNVKQLKKNSRIGWLFQIVVIVIIFYLSYKYLISP